MTGILKVDQIQNNTGTSALTINSSGQISPQQTTGNSVYGTYSSGNSWTPGANVVPSWAMDVTMVFTEVSHVAALTSGQEPGIQAYVGGSTAPSGSYNYIWWYAAAGGTVTLQDFRTAGHTRLHAGGFTNPANVFGGKITFSRTSTSSYVYHFDCQVSNKGYPYNHGWAGTLNLSGPISGLGWEVQTGGFDGGTARVYWS